MLSYFVVTADLMVFEIRLYFTPFVIDVGIHCFSIWKNVKSHDHHFKIKTLGKVSGLLIGYALIFKDISSNWYIQCYFYLDFYYGCHVKMINC